MHSTQVQNGDVILHGVGEDGDPDKTLLLSSFLKWLKLIDWTSLKAVRVLQDLYMFQWETEISSSSRLLLVVLVVVVVIVVAVVVVDYYYYYYYYYYY